ncbi:MAG: type II toxin-antitoxin system HicB family antitoxin [Candidatus Aminicenantes bacterium]|nr:type II toxin-antitoxin system HicB family antitoxin [Candidatus Aminicenantes bacterium]
MDDYRFSVAIGRNGDGWVAVCPEFANCEARGRSYKEALANILEAIQVRMEDCLGDDEDIPQAETVNFTMLRLSV